jgi:hypothetical protein
MAVPVRRETRNVSIGDDEQAPSSVVQPRSSRLRLSSCTASRDAPAFGNHQGCALTGPASRLPTGRRNPSVSVKVRVREIIKERLRSVRANTIKGYRTDCQHVEAAIGSHILADRRSVAAGRIEQTDFGQAPDKEEAGAVRPRRRTATKTATKAESGSGNRAKVLVKSPRPASNRRPDAYKMPPPGP